MSEIYIKNDVESLDLEEQGVNRTSNPINMCDINAINSDNNLEIENKIDVEEGILGLDCLKKELVDDDHDQPLQDTEMNENDYKINIQEVLMDTYDTEIKNEETVVKSENIKQECVFDIQVGLVAGSVDNIYCDLCGKDYAGYCSRCSSLSHCLSNNVSSTDPEWNTKTIPTNILEIKLVNDRSGVFAVRTIPKSVILGPFEGVLPIESTTGNMWKMKDKKLVNAENGNWMQHVCSTGNALFKNLDTFQFGGYLYYQTTREVNESDELLVCYREEEMQKSDNSEECYYIPIKLEQSQKVFACTLCCLGFRLEKCLTEHKSKCPHAEHNKAVEEIIECRTCNIWLEKQEYEEHHQVYCSEIYPRHTNYPAPTARSGNTKGTSRNNKNLITLTEILKQNESCFSRCEKGLIYDHTYCKRSILNIPKTSTNPIFNNTKRFVHFTCSKCSFQTKYENSLKFHNCVKKYDNKKFKCQFMKCLYKTEQNEHRESHTEVRNIFKCRWCPYQTDNIIDLNLHLRTHNKQDYKCGFCRVKFAKKKELDYHMQFHKEFHKEKKITKKEITSSSATVQKTILKRHLVDKHLNTPPTSTNTITRKFNLNIHVDKIFQCLHCRYQSNSKMDIANHFKIHRQFECDICLIRFSAEETLRSHIEIHTKGIKNGYKCSCCPYLATEKIDLRNHFKIHQPFQCDICLLNFTTKTTLNEHLNSHLSTKMGYTCFYCSFRSDDINEFEQHFNANLGLICDICQKKSSTKCMWIKHMKLKHEMAVEDILQCNYCPNKFVNKTLLQKHVEDKHMNVEDVYKCGECPYETVYELNLELHAKTHSNVRKFRCDLCKNRFDQEDDLKEHTAKEHQIRDDHLNLDDFDMLP